MIILKLFFIIFIIIIFYYYIKNNNILNEKFENKTHNNSDIYDKQYITFYNYINDLKNEHIEDLEILSKKNIFNHKDKNSIKILDAGCGSGIISNYLQKKDYDLTCVDKSESFLKYAELNNIFNRYILGNLENTQLFDNNEFNIIISDYDSFYLNNYASMINILKNYFLWLKNDGFIIFYLFNNKFLDPSPRNYSQYYFDDKGNKHSLTYFEGFSHNAWFIKDKFIKNKFIFYEKILIEKTLQSRIKITNYFFPDKNDLLKMIQDNGFKVSDIISFNDQNEYQILILHKK